MKRILTIIIAAAAAICLQAQTYDDIKAGLEANMNHYGGSSSPYEYVSQRYHSAPKGYEPFYISHFGRHGSRYHTTPDIFYNVDAKLVKAEEAGLLTDEGKALRARIAQAAKDTKKFSGDLSRVGAEEHKGIASRMYANYKTLFKSCPEVYAVSTTSPRVILSMAAFCEALKEQNPKLSITREAGDACSSYLNHYTREYREYYDGGAWRAIRDGWVAENLHMEKVFYSLFKDDSQFEGGPDGEKSHRFFRELFSACAIMPSCGFEPFYDIFTEQERFELWQATNMDQYMRKGPSGIGHDLAIDITQPLLRDFVERADNAVKAGKPAVDLRFGHGEGIMPVTALMGIEDASRVESDPSKMCLAWQDYRITSMAANVQWIFYSNGTDDVLMKVLLNERESVIPVETDCWPYYHWNDVKKYYNAILK